MSDSFQAFTAELESLAAAARETEPELPVLGPFIVALDEHLGDLREVKGRQQMHEARRREATQDLHRELTAAQDAAIQLRSLVRAELGPRDPRLARFGVAILRKPRPRKPADGGTPPTPAETATKSK